MDKGLRDERGAQASMAINECGVQFDCGLCELCSLQAISACWNRIHIGYIWEDTLRWELCRMCMFKWW